MGFPPWAFFGRNTFVVKWRNFLPFFILFLLSQIACEIVAFCSTTIHNRYVVSCHVRSSSAMHYQLVLNLLSTTDMFWEPCLCFPGSWRRFERASQSLVVSPVLSLVTSFSTSVYSLFLVFILSLQGSNTNMGKLNVLCMGHSTAAPHTVFPVLLVQLLVCNSQNPR